MSYGNYFIERPIERVEQFRDFTFGMLLYRQERARINKISLVVKMLKMLQNMWTIETSIREIRGFGVF